MIKDLLIDLFGTYAPVLSPVNLTLTSSDGLSELVVSAAQCGIDFLWLGKFALFIVCLFLIFKLLVSALAVIKR